MDEELFKTIWPIFSAEAREHLEQLSSGVLELERADAERTPGLIDALRRTAHSLKGSASSVGLEDVATLVHAIEDGLSSRAAADFDSRHIDALLEAISGIEVALARREGGGSDRIEDLDALVAALRGLPGPTPGDEVPHVSELWSIFRGEAHEHLDALSAGAPTDEAKERVAALIALGDSLQLPNLTDTATALARALDESGSASDPVRRATERLGKVIARIDGADATHSSAPSRGERAAAILAQLGEMLPVLCSPASPERAEIARRSRGRRARSQPSFARRCLRRSRS